MDSPLQLENAALRQQLDALLREARDNERKMRRFDQLERRLIASASLSELIGLLLADYRQAFALSQVTLVLVDPEHETRRTLDAEGEALAEQPGLQFLSTAAPLEALYAGQPEPRLGPFVAERHGFLFPESHGGIGSLALVPLSRQGGLIGSLQLASHDLARYPADAGTEFLERLAQIIAICLDSALSRERLKRAGLTDGLTGVQNRRYFDHRLQIEISQARRQRQPLACMFIDIDRFKRINDTYGHPAGDAVLRDVARLVQSQLRTSDTVARYGGEEFVALLPQTAGHHALEIAERIRRTVAETPFAHAGQAIPTRISIGLALLPGDADNAGELAQSLLARADQALYRAKHSGRDQVIHDSIGFSRSTARPALHRLHQLLRPWRQALPSPLSRLVRP